MYCVHFRMHWSIALVFIWHVLETYQSIIGSKKIFKKSLTELYTATKHTCMQKIKRFGSNRWDPDLQPDWYDRWADEQLSTSGPIGIKLAQNSRVIWIKNQSIVIYIFRYFVYVKKERIKELKLILEQM